MNCNLPVYPIELSTPLFSNVNAKSHCAIGTTYAILTCSIICAKEHGMVMHIRKMLNLPKPVALMASSKSAAFPSKNKKRIQQFFLYNNRYNNHFQFTPITFYLLL